LDPKQPYLFVSNHRDIVLDAAILQYVLDQYGHPTCHITFGANLMSNPLIADLGKCLKMFRTERNGSGGGRMDFYRNMTHLSAYIRHIVTECGGSIWIAQRNGRTKNGIDATDPAVMKMFSLSGNRDLASSMAALHIVPVAISYEWETCDIAKAVETYTTRQNGSYMKLPGEDLQSMINGIVAPKGRVHLEVCKPLETDDLESLSKSKTEFFPQVAALMDKRINAAFQLMPTHYIAHDLRSGTRQYAAFYDEEKEQQFHQHLGKVTAFSDCDTAGLRGILLDIYANSVDNCLKYVGSES
jgi:1-acyl-sn-glycerol-3-phosphate acyltransferase